MEVVEIAQRRGRHIEDVSEDEGEEAPVEQVNPSAVDPDEERFLRVLSRANTKPHFTPLEYDGKLDLDELMDWI